MTLARHLSLTIVIALGLAVGCAPASAAPPAKVLIVFHPGGVGERPRTVFKRLVDRPALSLGLLGATQGPYSTRQALLDISQGNRTSRSGYSPSGLPPMRLSVRGGRRITGWRAVVRRAGSAPAPIVPGLLAASVPGGAGFVGGEGGTHLEAVVAAGRDGRVAEVSLGPPGDDLARRAQGMLQRHALVVLSLPLDAAADSTLDEVVALREPGELILVIRTPPRSRATQLLPMAAIGLGEPAPGLLRSRTTRRDGLVAGHDVLPTVLEHLGVAEPSSVRGLPIFVSTARGRDDVYLRRLERRLRVVYPRRFPALRALLAALALVALAGLALRRRRWAWRVIGLSVLWVPTVALATAALAPGRTTELAIMSAGTVALAALTDRLARWPLAAAIPGIGGVAAYCVDLCLGSPLIVRSLLGPNPRFGSRWYGIGNELEAALPVMLLVGVAAAAGSTARSRRLALRFALPMLVLGAMVGAGRLGADVGGVITIGAGAAVAVLLSLPGPLSRRTIVLACLAPVLAVLALAGIDLATGGDSHFTTTILGAQDSGAIGDVIRRRTTLAANALFRGLMPVAAALAAAALVVGFRRRQSVYAAVAGRPAWAAALGGGAAAGIAGSLANDSGPVLLVIATVVLGAATLYVRNGPETEFQRNLPPPPD